VARTPRTSADHMKRRLLLLAGSIAPLAAAVRAQPRVTVINVAASNCPYCAKWDQQYKADWLASALYRKVRYVETGSPAVKTAYEETYWPTDLKSVLDKVPRKNGTPRFLIVQGNDIVFNEFGVNGWPKLLDRLQTVVG
jgi:hypothetical protein